MTGLPPLSPTDVDAWWFELERLSRGLGRIGPDEVCCEGLSPRQCSLLRRVRDGEGRVLGDLAREAGISASALSRALDRLEAAGLVERVRGQRSDGRAAGVRMTPAGEQTMGRIDAQMRRRTNALVEAIPADLRNPVRAALRQLNDALEAAGGNLLVGDSCCEGGSSTAGPDLLRVLPERIQGSCCDSATISERRE